MHYIVMMNDGDFIISVKDTYNFERFIQNCVRQDDNIVTIIKCEPNNEEKIDIIYAKEDLIDMLIGVSSPCLV